MDNEFWLNVWREGHIGFHRDAPMPLLTAHWSQLAVPAGSRVLVPLCGKTLDMPWLASQGLQVVGVELSPLAIQQFFAEHHLEPTISESSQGRRYRAGAIEIIHGDVMQLDAATLAGCDAIYDRAAIIALPADLRRRYAERVYHRLPANCRGLMITLDYPQSEMAGPPFAVDDGEVHALLDADFAVTQLDRRDILHSQPSFSARGVTGLHTTVYQLNRKA